MSAFWKIVLGIALAGSLVADVIRGARDIRHVWDYPFFFAVYGFLGCALIVYASKWAGKYWLQRREDYYDPYRAPAEVGESGPKSDPFSGEEADA